MRKPEGKLVVQTLAMPANTNANGDIFAGWILAQMDLGGGIFAKQISKSRCVTASIDSLIFKMPVHVGDVINCYAQLIEMGRSSMKIKIETWKTFSSTQTQNMVTEGIFTFVAINEQRIPHPADPLRRHKESVNHQK